MTKNAFPRPGFGINPLVVAAGLIVFGVHSGLGQAGAATTPTLASTASEPYVPTMTFDVASVRENKNVDFSGGFIMTGRLRT
jgi:hypothetical protein